jgi:hypothetical protein
MNDAEGRNQCVVCGTRSPPTDTNYTLISARFGWRLARGIDGEGNRVMQWHCPTCWAKVKAAGEQTGSRRLR